MLPPESPVFKFYRLRKAKSYRLNRANQSLTKTPIA
ncbi:hypothetical protein RDI58_001302 [Solanum bulbocastanum]|uniref:Uncharacterized protein n=1 Tax=Solanum bulbocastanum TaxID=147425 RepID=A0AAN8YN35_SOLBU